jgi:hypothetical protein
MLPDRGRGKPTIFLSKRDKFHVTTATIFFVTLLLAAAVWVAPGALMYKLVAWAIIVVFAALSWVGITGDIERDRRPDDRVPPTG